MSKRDRFNTGFLLGTLVGGVVGGIIGTIVTNRRLKDFDPDEDSLLSTQHNEGKKNKAKTSIDHTKSNLEAKIAELSTAIDDVRFSLGNLNVNESEVKPINNSRE